MSGLEFDKEQAVVKAEQMDSFEEASEIEGRDLSGGVSSLSHEYENQYMETSDMEDRKPSQRELDIHSRRFIFNQSVCRKERTISKTHSAQDGVHAGEAEDTPDSIALNLPIPRVALARLPASYLSQFSYYRYQRLSHRKKPNYGRMFVESEIMKPVYSSDGVVTSYQCVECSKLFIKRQTLRQHFITHTDRFACPYCVARCKSKGDLIRHIQTHTKEKPFHCDVCNSNYARESILKKHMKTQRHLRSVLENKNLAHLKVFQNREKHVDTTSNNSECTDFICGQCQKVTFSRYEYRKHIRSHTLKFICDICQKGCKSLLLLKIHKRFHSKPANLVCTECSRCFGNYHSLREHTKLHKPDSLKRIMDELNFNSAMKKHKICTRMKSEAQLVSKPKALEGDQIPAVFKCEDCDKRFSSSKHLARHQCPTDSTYICGVCIKTFSSICKLKIHLKLHDRVIKCDICDIVFYEETELEEHVQEEHTDSGAHTEVPVGEFTCRLCYDHFDSVPDLERHMKDHTPTMMFSGRALYGKKPVLERTNSTSSVNVQVKAEVTSDDDDERISKEPGNVEDSKYSISDDDKTLDSENFQEVIGGTFNRSYKQIQNRSSDNTEVCSAVNEVLKSEAVSSGESDVDELETFSGIGKPLYYSREDIIKKHCTEFERHSERDAKLQTFKCRLCCKVFEEDIYLRIHLEHHVCEFCNVFFKDTDELATHRSQHEHKHQNQTATRMNRAHSSNSKEKRTDFNEASDSENELKDELINSGDFEEEPSDGKCGTNFLRKLSHDEIMHANRCNFEKYSIADPNTGTFACTICHREFARGTTLTRHMKTHACPFCNKFFYDKTDMPEHRYKHRKTAAIMKKKLTGENTTIRPCSLVSKPNRILFEKHSYVDRTRNIYQCTLCHRDFVRRTVLTRHLKTHVCGACDRFFEDKYELAKHILFHPGVRQDQGGGEENEKEEEEQDEEVEEEEEEEEYKSDDNCANSDEFNEADIEQTVTSECAANSGEVSFENQTSLQKNGKHQSGISLSGQTSSSDDDQDDKVTFPQGLRVEINGTSSEQAMYVVPDTDSQSFQVISRPVQVLPNPARPAASNSHHHGKKSKKMIISPQLLATDRDRPFECGECGKRFFKSKHLVSHLTIHTGERPFMCTYCGKAFSRAAVLNKHMKTHRKPCKVCGSIFTSKFELDVHMSVHRTSTFLS